MQGENRFLNFAEQVIARHRGFGQGFSTAAMLYLTDQPQEAGDLAVPQQNITTNLYHIRNIKEENYLFRQNLTFLTQVLENKIYHNLYPTVEKQIEKTIREELPQAETKLIETVSQQLYRLVQQGGVEQFGKLKTQILSEHQETENITLRQQEILFRKIENIWNSSVYEHQMTGHRETEVTRQERIFDRREMLYREQERLLTQKETLKKEQERLLIQKETLKKEQEQVQTQKETLQKEQEHILEQREIVHNPQVLNKEKQFLGQQEVVRHQRETVLQQPAPEIHRMQEPAQMIHAEYPEAQKEPGEVLSVPEELVQETENVLERTLRLVRVQQRRLSEERQQLVQERLQQKGEILRQQKAYEKELRQIKTEKQTKTEKEIEIETEKKIGTAKETGLEKQTEIKKYAETETEHLMEKELHQTQTLQKEIVRNRVRTKEIQILKKELPKLHLEYSSDEAAQISQEMMEILHTELQNIPQAPKLIEAQTETVVKTAKLEEKTKMISQTILSRLETAGFFTEQRQKPAEKTVMLQRISHAIMEYAVSGTTGQELETQIFKILKLQQRQSEQGSVLTNAGVGNHIRPQVRTETAALVRDQAPIVYRPEEVQAPQQQRTRQLEQKVEEVVKTIKTVEEKTVVQKEQLMERQKEVVQEVLRSNVKLLVEGENADYIRSEVQQSVGEQIDQSVNQIANRVYRRLEERLKSERGRRGLI